MIVRVTFYQTEAGKLDEGGKMWDTEVAPLLKKQKGFQKAFRVEDRDEPGGLVIVFWDNREAEEAWRNSKEHEELSPKLHTLITELVVNRPFELVKEV